MMANEILFAGGSGMVGSRAVAWFRKRHPDTPVLVGGRNVDKAGAIASEMSPARAVHLDVSRPRLGLERDVSTSAAAVLMLVPDPGLHGLRLAQELRVPYLSIGNGLVEIAPEVAHFAHRSKDAPVLLASAWAAGASLFLALDMARSFDHVRAIRVGVVLDEKDPAGPTSLEDIEQLQKVTPAALSFVGGKRAWLDAASAKRRIEAIDGRSLEAAPFAPLDMMSLHAVTGAGDIRFDLVTDISSSRRRGGPPAAEIVVELDGESNGKSHRARGSLEFEHGQASLTALSVVLLLESTLGAAPGLYLPELVTTSSVFLAELKKAGATIRHERTGAPPSSRSAPSPHAQPA